MMDNERAEIKQVQPIKTSDSGPRVAQKPIHRKPHSRWHGDAIGRRLRSGRSLENVSNYLTQEGQDSGAPCDYGPGHHFQATLRSRAGRGTRGRRWREGSSGYPVGEIARAYAL